MKEHWTPVPLYAAKPSVSGRAAWLLLGVGFAAVLLVHFIWELQNDRPPAWDMAHHQLMGWKYLEAAQAGRLPEEFASISRHYPPLYYLIESAVLQLFPGTQFLALLSNLPALLLIAFCTFKMAVMFIPPRVAWGIGLLPLLMPMSAWLSRESLLEPMLAAWVTAGGYLIYHSEFLQKKTPSLLFGLVCAAGTLTKWLFPAYLFFPLLYAFFRCRDKRRFLINGLDGLLLALPLVLFYYLPNLRFLLDLYPTTPQDSWIPWRPYPRHGEPGLNNFWGWIYYPRVLASYYLFLPFTVVLAWSAFRWGRNRDLRRHRLLQYLWVWVAGAVIIMTFVTPKDPRFIMPVITPLAILVFVSFRNDRFQFLCIVLAFLIFIAVSFPLLGGKFKQALFVPGQDRDYQGIQREWVFFQDHYFEVLGPPQRENWRLHEIVGVVPPKARVGFLPELSHFHSGALVLTATQSGKQIQVLRLGSTDSPELLGRVSFVVGKSGSQGISYTTLFNEKIYEHIKRHGWPIIGVWDLPDRSQAFLWRNPSPSL
ncbi:MAG: phospholipid carrier-dependent glycosyltransferase [Acidobacteria bacterium]|nr:phospholipid carrier-dependent glycosyltransferase [Acidobacteriota bacterium]